MGYIRTIEVRCRKCKNLLPLWEFDDAKNEPGRKKTFCRRCCSELSEEAKTAKCREHSMGKGSSYISRSKYLKQLGFRTYAAYLKSDLWKSIRARVFSSKGRVCYLCGKEASQLHHNRYHINDLTGKRIKYINPVCGGCHKEIEFREGSKSTVRQARSAFQRKRNVRKAELRNESVGRSIDDALSAEFRSIVQ